MNIRDRIKHFDFDTADPRDIAVLLEQVFMYHGDIGREGGTIILAEGVLRQFSDSIRRRATPELQVKTSERLRGMRASLAELDASLRGLEKDTSNVR